MKALASVRISTSLIRLVRPEEIGVSGPSAAVPHPEVIAAHGNIHHWIEPWYGAYAILGALTAGLAVISIPLVVIGDGGDGIQIGTTIAVQNLGVLSLRRFGVRSRIVPEAYGPSSLPALH